MNLIPGSNCSCLPLQTPPVRGVQWLVQKCALQRAWSSSSEINIEKCQWLCPWTYGQLVREKLLDLDWGDVRSRKPPVWVLNLFLPTEIQLLTDLRGYSEIHREVFSTRAENLPIRAKQSDQVAKSERKPNQNKPPNMINSTTVLEIPISYDYFRRK